MRGAITDMAESVDLMENEIERGTEREREELS